MNPIAGAIIYLLINGRAFEAIIIIIITITIFFSVVIVSIGLFLKIFFPEQKTPEKEVKERVKVVYVIQNSAGNEIRIEENDKDKLSEKLGGEKSVNEKQSWFSRVTQFIIRIIILTIKTIVISTAIIISIVIVVKIFTK